MKFVKKVLLVVPCFYYMYNIRRDLSDVLDVIVPRPGITPYNISNYTRTSLIEINPPRNGVNGTKLQSMIRALISNKTQADDARLLQVLQDHMLDPPSQGQRKISYPLFRTPQAEAVEKIMENKRGGFFVECGALDGERSSNTIYLEHRRGWSGLLVEVDPSWYKQLRGKNRRSYSINACMSPHNYPSIMEFKESAMGGGEMVKETKGKYVLIRQVYCFPLYSMLLALNRTHVDYFSLDVEGLELAVLRTIPFDRLDISILTVEYVHVKGGITALKRFMTSKGYLVYSRIDVVNTMLSLYARDLVFVKKGLIIT